MSTRVSSPSFVGRTEELASLTSVLAATVGGSCATVLIGGDAGIGKSRLVAEFANRARSAGAAVFTGSCLDLGDGGLPYGPIHEILRAMGDSLDPEGRREVFGPGADIGALRPAEALPGVLERLTRRQPVAMVIEDVHWADGSTRDIIRYLAAGPSIPRLGTIVTYRSDDPGLDRRHPLRSLLAELERLARVTHLRLRGLGAADQLAQLRGILGQEPDADLVRSVLERSDGNPFLTEELVATAGQTDLSPGLRTLLQARIDQLDDRTQAILRMAAVGGRQIDHRLLAGVAGGPPAELNAGLRTAVDHHLLVTQGERYEFRHALVRETVLDDVLPGERVATHEAYARTIERHPGLVPAGRAATLAHHWAAAGQLGPARSAAIEAGLDAEASYALPEAQRYFEWALSHWDETDRTDFVVDSDDLPMTYTELLERVADVASRAGDVERAAELIAMALAHVGPGADRGREAILHERRGWCLLQAGRISDALSAYERAVALVPATPPTVARARVMAARADALERWGRVDEASLQANKAIDAAIAARSPADEGHARHTLGVTLAAAGQRDLALVELDRALAIAEEGGDVADAVGVHVNLWRELAQLGRGSDVLDRARRGAATARDRHMVVLAGVLDGMAIGYYHQLGRWAEADALERTTVPTHDAGTVRLEQLVGLIVGGLLDVDRGELDRAGDRLEQARSYTFGLHDGRVDGLLYRGLAERALLQGNVELARRLVDDGLARTNVPEMSARLLLVGLRSVETEERLAMETTARSWVDRLAELDEYGKSRLLEPASELRASAQTGRAEWTRISGISDTEAWAEASARWTTLRFPLPTAYAMWRQGEAILTAGGPRDDAIDLFVRALGVVGELGARPWVQLIERSARRARLPVGTATTAPTAPSEPSASPGSDFGVTAREHEVLELLGRGWTNRQIAATLFISEKTARVHVSHILAKLGASTRGAAVDVAHRNGLLSHRPE